MTELPLFSSHRHTIRHCLLSIIACIVAVGFTSCSTFMDYVEILKTRTEVETYTIVKQDTTTQSIPTNQPGSRSENGIIHPSTRVIERNRNLLTYDSIVKRTYPAFIRLGLFESVGLIGGNESGRGIGAGMFGMMFNDSEGLTPLTMGNPVGKSSSFFGSGLYRYGIAEVRLRWFQDAKDWTIGTSIYERIVVDGKDTTLNAFRSARVLGSLLPIYFRKRFYISESIPYLCITPSVGIGYYPSQYVNLSASLDAGSIGGLNARAYLGLIAGSDAESGTIGNNASSSFTFPYFGLGISVLDFHNRVPELYREWKDHEHSSWQVGLFDMTLINTGLDSSAIASGASIVKGMILRLAPAAIALPSIDKRLYVGTSLFNIVVAGAQQDAGSTVIFRNPTPAMAYGVLPVRIGYWQPVLRDELTLEPFVEYSYYPHSIFHLGARLNIQLPENLAPGYSDKVHLGLNLGYINAAGINTINSDLASVFGGGNGNRTVIPSFSTAYVGVTIGLQSKLFHEEELRYK